MRVVDEHESPGGGRQGSIDSPHKLTKSEAGRLGARARWGADPIIVRLDQVDDATARVIRAILRAAENADTRKAVVAVSETSAATAGAEVHGNARSTA